MSFLQPWILAALPLMAVPVLIHLINRNRHRSVRWGAMMFLVRANRMHKGMARLRYLVILLLRMAAVGAIVFAVSRPLVSGKLGFIGMGKPDVTLILLDRSVSMESQDPQSGESKRSTALRKLSELLEQRGYGSQLVLIDSATGQAQPIESPRDLLDLPSTRPTATSANLPTMFENGLAYLKRNEAARADLWICSDLNENDWDPDSGRWSAIREQFAQMKGVHHFLLSYAADAAENVSVRVANVKRRQIGKRAELVLDVLLHATATPSAGNTPRRVPVEFQINRARSVVELEWDAEGASLLGHRIPIDETLRGGWGSAHVPGDANPLDNTFYFVFSEPPARNSVIVTDDPQIGEVFRLGLAIPSEPGLRHNATVLKPSQVGEIDWESTALLVWQAPLPEGLVADQVQRFVGSGRVAMFFPPSRTADGRMFGTSWGAWQPLAAEHDRKLSWWRGDSDLLAHVGSGDALPLNDLRAYRYCSIVQSEVASSATPLAILGGAQPLLNRVATDDGGVYFCSTLPTARFSSLQRDAVSFYVMLQRAISLGTRSMAAAAQRNASATVSHELLNQEAVAPRQDAPTVSERGLHAGVYRDEDQWMAVNRSLAEDEAQHAATAVVDPLFAGLSYQRIDDSVGDTSSLASEIWRSFLFLMLAALMIEAVLCLPEKKVQQPQFGFEQTPTARTSP